MAVARIAPPLPVIVPPSERTRPKPPRPIVRAIPRPSGAVRRAAAVAVRRLQAAPIMRAAAAAVTRGLRTWPPRLTPIRLRGLGEEPAPSADPIRVRMLVDIYRVTSDRAIAAGSELAAFAFGGSIYAYDHGVSPERLWGEQLARDLARSILDVAGIAALRLLLADGRWTLVAEADELNAWDSSALTAAGARTGMGWVPRAVPREAGARFLDQLAIQLGMIPFGVTVAGAAAAGAAAAEAGAAASAAEGATAAAAAAPDIVAGGARAAAAARTTSAAFRELLAGAVKVVPPIAKYTAIALGAGYVAGKIPDIVNTQRAAQQDATRAGIEAAGAWFQQALQSGDPGQIEAAMNWLREFQRGAADSDKWLYAALGVAGGYILAKR